MMVSQNTRILRTRGAQARLFSVVLLASLGTVAAQAASITYTGTSGDGTRSAQVVFTEDADKLIVTLSNTSLASLTTSADLLTGVFFSLPSSISLTRVSATIDAGGKVISSSGERTIAGGVVGGEWAYARVSPSGLLANAGISSTGIDLFGPGDRFPGDNLQGPTSPDGAQYGIATANYNPALANGGLAGQEVIVGSVTFVLSGLPENFDLSSIGNVTFQYGTSLCEGGCVSTGRSVVGDLDSPVPEPATWGMLGAGLVGLGLLRRRRR